MRQSDCICILHHAPALGDLSLTAVAAAVQAVGLHAMRQWHRFRAAEVANLVWALAILKAPSAELWCGPQAHAQGHRDIGVHVWCQHTARAPQPTALTLLPSHLLRCL